MFESDVLPDRRPQVMLDHQMWHVAVNSTVILPPRKFYIFSKNSIFLCSILFIIDTEKIINTERGL
jgi:hypothetical protein